MNADDSIKAMMIEQPWYTRFVAACAVPFSYPTGFYFKGRKNYHCPCLGICTICGMCFILFSLLVLIAPIAFGSIVESDLTIVPFNTPADVPAS